MNLKSETAVEYFFDNAYLSYCKHHDTLIVCNNHEDRIVLSGVKQKDINNFIECYFEYILDDAPLKEYFKERLSKVKEEEEIEKLIEDVS